MRGQGSDSGQSPDARSKRVQAFGFASCETCYLSPGRGERKVTAAAPTRKFRWMPDLVRGDGKCWDGRQAFPQAVFCFSDLERIMTMAFGLRLPFTPGEGQDVHPPPRAGCRAPLRRCRATRAASWSGRSYAAIAREGFMRNPVAHRATRMIAEAAASVPWVVFDGGAASRSGIRSRICSIGPTRTVRATGFSRRFTVTLFSRAMAGSTR
jgi:hypothetical protein